MISLKTVPLMLLVCLYCVSCEMLGIAGSDAAAGELRIAFASGQDLTRVESDVPDTSDFTLTVKDADGNVIYDGKYGDSPESIEVDPGSYSVSVVSSEFVRPAFSAPQYGDEQCVVVPSGETVNVKLVCRQLNSGVRLKIDPGFLTEYPDGVLFLKSSQGGLMYGYTEKRVAYFSPGNVSLLLSNGGTDQTLLTKTLEAQQILVLGVSVVPSSSGSASQSAGRVSVAVDTTRNWISDTYIIGGNSGKGGDAADALTVSQAKASVGEEDVWVSGYIVGGDLSSSSASFEAPFSSRTNIVLGPRSSVSDRSSCVSVQLPSGDLRDALNLVDNLELLGTRICIKGDIVEAYYGLVGIKNISEYEFYQ